MTEITPGSKVLARNAWGEWIPKIAVTGVERGHDFPIVWVEPVGKRGDAVPWPAEHVKLDGTDDPEPSP